MLIKKKIVLLVLMILLSLTVILFQLIPTNDIKIASEEKHNYVSGVFSVVRDSYIYTSENSNYNRVGDLFKGTLLMLETIQGEGKYLKIKDTEFYVYYKDINKYEGNIPLNKEYTAFNEKVVTKPTFKLLYNSRVVLIINVPMEFNIFMKLDGYYLIKFNDQYFNISIEDVEKVVLFDNSVEYAYEIPVLNYHFFYDSEFEECSQIICLEKRKFEEQLIYLKSNGFKTLSIEEFQLWMDKKIALPRKSVLLTVDDGALGTDTHLIDLLEKYDMKATLFLVTAWWNKDKYISPNLDIQSHGYDIHIENYCSNVSRGARGLCMSVDDLINDFNLSKEALGGSVFAFVYPYYLYNNNMIEALKSTNFTLAFIGGNVSSNQTNNKYLIPRYVIYSYTSISVFKDIVN